jgi:hypothetical protein
VLGLAELDTLGLLLSGRTSAGKTLAQRLAASAFSSPTESGGGLFQSARTTANAIEFGASRANGTVLVLDELAHVPGRDLARLVYSLSGNVGKARMTADARPRAQHEWKTFVLMSAERGLAEMIRSDGAQMPVGVALRIVDIDVTGVDRNVPQTTLDAIARVTQNFGDAGPTFVRALHTEGLFHQGLGVRDNIQRTAHDLAGEDVDSAVRRAALPFGLLSETAKFLQRFALLPADADLQGAVRWAWENFRVSPESEVLDDEKVVVERLRDWVATHWGTGLIDVHDETPARPPLGWFDADFVYLTSEGLCEATGKILKEREVARVLNRLGMLAKRKSVDCTHVNYVPVIGVVKAYVLRRSEFRRVPVDELIPL